MTTDALSSTAPGGLRLECGELPGSRGSGDAVVYISYLDVEIGTTRETFLFQARRDARYPRPLNTTKP